jgi:hypothetical protein
LISLFTVNTPLRNALSSPSQLESEPSSNYVEFVTGIASRENQLIHRPKGMPAMDMEVKGSDIAFISGHRPLRRKNNGRTVVKLF